VFKLLFTRRWLSFTAVALVAILAFGALSMWQWNRAEEKRDQNQVVAAGAALRAVPLSEALSDPSEWRHVVVSGTYGSEQRLLRNRPLDGSNGFWVVSPLIFEDGDVASESVVWVARGWIPQRTAATEVVDVPTAPSGPIEVSGYLRASAIEPARPSSAYPVGQIAALNTDDLTQSLDLSTDPRLTNWYLQDDLAQTRQSTVKALPLPKADDAKNLSYAGQWLIFASIAVVGWFFFLRREAKELASPNPVQNEQPDSTANPYLPAEGASTKDQEHSANFPA
jgi:cytochrome oxidase assembly protein ShyY1